ncbi:MAG: uroporphyrinogen decarboxylase family protein [Promethearchaeia archaeon]
MCLERVSASFISPQIFEDLVLDNLLKIVEENVKNGLTTVLHMDTNWTPFFKYFLEFPKNGKYILHLEDSDIFKAKEMLGDRFCIMGNIQTKLLRFGTKQQIIERTKELIDGCKEGGGYMMAEGCEIAPDTPMRNLKTWVDTTIKYGKY